MMITIVRWQYTWLSILYAVPILSELPDRVLSLSLLLTDSTAGLGETTLSKETGGIGRAVRLEGMVMVMIISLMLVIVM